MKLKKLLFSALSVMLVLALCAVPSMAIMTGVVSTASDPLRIRSGAGTSYGQIGSAPKGATVTILETVNTDSGVWYKITYSGVTGYVSGAYISNVVTVPDETPNPNVSDDVPAIYASYIQQLKATHPNWVFKFYDTWLEWSDVVSAETREGINAISGSRPISYRSTTVRYNPDATQTGVIAGDDGELNIRSEASISQGDKTVIAVLENGVTVSILGISGNWYQISFVKDGQPCEGYAYYKNITDIKGAQIFTPIEGSSWFQAHGQVVQYYMDPRNMLSENTLFQFEEMSFEPLCHTLAGVESILSGSWMAGKNVDNGNKTFAQVIFEAGQAYNVSPYQLASRIMQEIGKASPSAAATGAGDTNGNYKGIYNFYNIGANTGISDGLNWAYNGGQPGSYGTPWDTQYKSIMGGAQYIASKYIGAGQNTLYFEKFDVIATGGLYNHQYMSNVEAVYNESKNVYTGYTAMNMLDNPFVFIIPVYRNMPAVACHLPEASSQPNLAPDTAPVIEVMRGGDVDGNGNLGIVDVKMILMHCTGSITLSSAQFSEADVDGNGELGIIDAKLLLIAVAAGQTYVPKA